MNRLLACAALAAVAACEGARDDVLPADAAAPEEAPAQRGAPAEDPVPAADRQRPQKPAAPSTPAKPLLGEAVALAEWRVAANREHCAPLALRSDGGVPAKARRADFSGGWAVAFDSPRRRSAYGFAGVGALSDDQASDQEKRRTLEKQWPHFRELGGGSSGLPKGSFAGYGVMGAQAYPRSNPQGRGLHSLAYLRIPGQQCMYNVWSRISRRHLETLLDNLQLVDTAPAQP